MIRVYTHALVESGGFVPVSHPVCHTCHETHNPGKHPALFIWENPACCSHPCGPRLSLMSWWSLSCLLMIKHNQYTYNPSEGVCR